MIDKNYKVDDYKSVTYKNKLIKHINAKGYISKDEDYTTDEDITKEQFTDEKSTYKFNFAFLCHCDLEMNIGFSAYV